MQSIQKPLQTEKGFKESRVSPPNEEGQQKKEGNPLKIQRIPSKIRRAHTDGKGNVSYGGEWKDWYSQGDRNILQYAERSVDLASDSDIPDGSQVRLHPYVAAGYSDAAVEQYIYQKTSASQAVYQISGTTLINQLKLVSYN